MGNKRAKTNLFQLTDDQFIRKFTNGRGVYFVIAINSNNRPVPINRVCGIDVKGILYIGSTPKRDFLKRLSDFRKCVLPTYNGKSHSAGRTYCGTPVLMKKFPADRLAIRLEYYDEPETNEKRLIKEYRLKFGEVPPLNSH